MSGSPSHENENGGNGDHLSEERIQYLEKLVHDQEEEIVCLKASVSDLLRRVSILENFKSKEAIAPSLPVRSGEPKPAVRSKLPVSTNKSTELRLKKTRNPITPTPSKSKHGGSISGTILINSSCYDLISSNGYQNFRDVLNIEHPENYSTNSLDFFSPQEAPVYQRSFTHRSRPYSRMSQRSRSSSAKNSTVLSTNSIHIQEKYTDSFDAPSSRARPSALKTMKNIHPIAWRPGGTSVQDKPVVVLDLDKLYNHPNFKISVERIRNYNLKEKLKYLPEDGTVKTYLRGRPVISYLPTNAIESYDPNVIVDAPSEKLRLEWVYGYRGRDCRDNIYYLPTGEIAYFVAAVVVLYNIENNSQRHYLGHNDDIKCLTLHPDKITMASGQVTGHEAQYGKAHIRIWSSISLHTLHIIGVGEFTRAVCTIAFSKLDGGIHLAAVDESNDHVLSIWNWEKHKKITETKSSTEQILSIEYSPVKENALVTIGKNHISFWNLDNGTLSRRQGIFDKYEKSKIVICLAFADNGDMITGDSVGNIFIWPKDSTSVSQQLEPVHDGGVFSLCFTKDGNLISGGGRDRKLVVWDRSYKPTDKVMEIPEWFGPVRTIIEGPGNMLIVGTTKNSIIHCNSDTEFSAIVTGHQDEFWGLAMHPRTHQFLTAGIDCQVSLWDALAKKSIWTTKVSLPITCISFYPVVQLDQEDAEENIIALGCSGGKWLVMDLLKHEVNSVHGDCGMEDIQCIEYSPDGNYLAVGSRDNNIYIYQVLENGLRYSKVGRCVRHSSFVLHIDWSKDSSYLRSMSGDYEIIYWTPADCKPEPSVSSLRDVEWISHNVTLGWDTTGIWPEGADGTDINCCDISKSRHLLTTGEDSGLVKLFKYPSTQLLAKCNSYRGHSSHVTNVKFMFDDSRLVSIGGKDAAVLQWEISSE